MFWMKKSLMIVSLKSDQSFRGILARATRELLVLQKVELLSPGGEITKVDGELVVFKADVSFIQKLN